MSIYPSLAIKENRNPNAFYAIPLIGFFAKIIMAIPIFIEAFFLSLAAFFIWIINSFVILFTGQYWDTAYIYFLSLMKFSTKIGTYFYGLTDQYPGFSLDANNSFTLEIAKPKSPNRFFAIPLFGFLARIILLIPYYIFSLVMSRGSWAAMIVAWFPVLFQQKFPESVYEFESDTLRIGLANVSYMTGLSDSYPSFKISMDHQTIKIILIIVGAFLVIINYSGRFNRPRNQYYRYQQNIYIPQTNNAQY